MQQIKFYTKGIQSFIKPIEAELVNEEFDSDGFHINFKSEKTSFKDADVATIVTTVANDANNAQTVHFSLNDDKTLLRPKHPFIHGGEYFKHRIDFKDQSGVVVGSIKDWKSPIAVANLDIDEAIDPEKLYFCTINLRPFYAQQGIIGVLYGDLSPKEQEQLFSGEFYDPQAVRLTFPQLHVAQVEYDLDVEQWHFELFTGIIHNHAGQYSFEQVSEAQQVEFERYQEAVSPQ